MVPHPKTPILNCFYHLLWFYVFTVSEFSCLAKSNSFLWHNSFAPYSQPAALHPKECT